MNLKSNRLYSLYLASSVECNMLTPCIHNYIQKQHTYLYILKLQSYPNSNLPPTQTNTHTHTSLTAPTAPVLNRKEDSDISHTVTIQWNSSFDSNTYYNISIAPSPPQCRDPCVYRTDRTSLSISLEVGVQYNMTGRAERCNGTLSSNESAVLHVTLPGIIIV